MAKPRVLPEPVRPRPRMSRPASASGSAAAWIGNGVVMPAPTRAVTIGAGTPRSAKVTSSGVISGISGIWATWAVLGLLERRRRLGPDLSAGPVLPADPGELSAGRMDRSMGRAVTDGGPLDFGG